MLLGLELKKRFVKLERLAKLEFLTERSKLWEMRIFW